MFQTKDPESALDEYVITRRGRLVRTKRGFLAPRPCHVVCPIHQDLRIYDSVEVAPEEREWVEYVTRGAEVVGPKLWRSAAAPGRWATGRPKARRGSRPKS